MLLGLMLAIALATLVSEDLACVAAGLMVARGALGLAPALTACFLGILGGDLLLYGSGRVLGSRVVRVAPFRWLIAEADLARGRAWFAQRGPAAILGSRFVPGLRFPTYVAAGLLRAPFRPVLAWFAIAAAIWVPLLVGSAVLIGRPMLDLLARYQRLALPILGLGLLGLLVTGNLLLPALTWRGRRRLLGRWRRWTRWEYWPMGLFYPPVVAWVLWLGLRRGGLTLFTASNPAIPGGGFIGESKHAILSALEASGAPVPPHRLLPIEWSLAQRLERVECFRAEAGLGWPLVLKPDAGQRGAGLFILRSDAALREALASARVDYIVQAYASGEEFGVFYARRPDEPRGRIISLTEKRFTRVVGDGVSPLGDLILRDPRAVCMAPRFERALAARLWDVPEAGQAVPLVEIGTHSRGAEFRDGGALVTPALETAIDRISQAFEGFYFGRYDLRAASAEALGAGHFSIVELNGVSAESTHVYDARYSVLDAWRTLFVQWRLAFEIGAANRDRGARVAPLRELVADFLAYRSAEA